VDYRFKEKLKYMKRMFKIFTVLAVSIVFLSACVDEVDPSDKEIQNNIMTAYMELNYPNVEADSSGIYIVDNTPGNGDRVVEDDYIQVEYLITNLYGDISSYTSEDLAKQLGTYATNKYYGPLIWHVASGDVYPGVDNLVETMNDGGQATAIIAPWLLTDYSYTTYATSSIKKYTVKIDGIIKDIDAYEDNLLQTYSDTYHNSVDSLEDGFYFKMIEEGEHEDSDTITDGEYMKVNYVGRYLNGQVFDTNVADTALKYGFYSDSDTYSTLSITYYSDYDTMVSYGSSYVEGFIKALNKMDWGDHAVTFFHSDLAYGDSGNLSSNSGIPPYTPLCFELWVDDED